MRNKINDNTQTTFNKIQASRRHPNPQASSPSNVKALKHCCVHARQLESLFDTLSIQRYTSNIVQRSSSNILLTHSSCSSFQVKSSFSLKRHMPPLSPVRSSTSLIFYQPLSKGSPLTRAPNTPAPWKGFRTTLPNLCRHLAPQGMIPDRMHFVSGFVQTRRRGRPVPARPEIR